VHENAVQLGVKHAVGPTKGRTARSVPVPQFVLDVLAQECAAKALDDLVFLGRDGGYLPRAEILRRVVPRCGDTRRSPAGLAARPSAHMCVPGRVGRGERARFSADARTQGPERDVAGLCGLVRQRPGRPRHCTPAIRSRMWPKCGQAPILMAASRRRNMALPAGYTRRALAVAEGFEPYSATW